MFTANVVHGQLPVGRRCLLQADASQGARRFTGPTAASSSLLILDVLPCKGSGSSPGSSIGALGCGVRDVVMMSTGVLLLGVGSSSVEAISGHAAIMERASSLSGSLHTTAGEPKRWAPGRIDVPGRWPSPAGGSVRLWLTHPPGSRAARTAPRRPAQQAHQLELRERQQRLARILSLGGQLAGRGPCSAPTSSSVLRSLGSSLA